MTAALDAVFTGPSAAVFFDALAAADQAARDNDWNALLGRTAPTPDTFASCVCGAELSIVSTAITLTVQERQAAAEAMAWHEQPDYSVLVGAAIRAVNTVRARDDERFTAEFRDAHAYCGDDL